MLTLAVRLTARDDGFADTIQLEQAQLQRLNATAAQTNAGMRGVAGGQTQAAAATATMTRAAGAQSLAMGDATRSMVRYGAALIGITAAAALLRAAAGGALALSAALGELSTLVDDTAADMPRLERAARSMGTAFGTGAVPQVQALYQAISAGATSVEAATATVAQANRIAIGGVTDVTTAVDVLTTAVNAYGAGVLSVEDASDALFVGMRAGKTTIGELAAALGQVIPIAAALKIPFDELVAGVAALTTSGLSTSQAVTGLRGILSQITKPSSDAAKLAAELGLEFNAQALEAKGLAGFLEEVIEKTGGNVDAMAKLFGEVEAVSAALSFAGGAGEQFAGILDDMTTKAGATETAFAKVADTADHRVDVALAKMGDRLIDVGDTILRGLVPALELGANALTFFAAALEAVLGGPDTTTRTEVAIGSNLQGAIDGMDEDVGRLRTFREQLDREAQGLQQRLDFILAQSSDPTAYLEQIRTDNDLAETLAAVEEIDRLIAGLGGPGASGRLGTGGAQMRLDLEAELARLRDEAANDNGSSGGSASPVSQEDLRNMEFFRDLAGEGEAAQDAFNEAMRRGARITEQLRTPQEEYTATLAELTDLLGTGAINQETFTRGAEAAAGALADAAVATDDAAQSTIDWERAWRGLGSLAGSVLADIRRGAFDAGAALERLADLIFQVLVINPFEQALGNIDFGDVFDDLFGSADTAHTGGVIGARGLVGANDNDRRVVSLDAFRGAPRFRRGGQAGLAPGEVPIVAHEGEVIGWPNQLARAFGGGGQPRVSVVIEDHRRQSGGESGGPPIGIAQGLGPDGEAQVRVMVYDAFSDLVESGKLHPVMAGAYGVRAQGAG